MNRSCLLLSLCLLASGCRAQPGGDEALAIYEAVFRAELEERGSAVKDGKGVYLRLDGEDPPAALLDRLRERWPALEGASRMPKGKWHQINAGELNRIDRNTAEVRGGFSNGMDGRLLRYRVVRKQGQWVVEKVTIEAIS